MYALMYICIIAYKIIWRCCSFCAYIVEELVHTYMYICMCTCTCTYSYDVSCNIGRHGTNTHRCTHTHIHTYTCLFIHMFVHRSSIHPQRKRSRKRCCYQPRHSAYIHTHRIRMSTHRRARTRTHSLIATMSYTQEEERKKEMLLSASDKLFGEDDDFEWDDEPEPAKV